MTCPFINAGYACCSPHLNMRRLDQAFAYCHNRYAVCPVYIQLTRTPALQNASKPQPQLQTSCPQP